MATALGQNVGSHPKNRPAALKIASRVALVQLLAAAFFLWREHVRLPLLLGAMAVVVVVIAIVVPRPFVWCHKAVASIVGRLMGWVGKAAIALIAIPLLSFTWVWQRVSGTALLTGGNTGGWDGRTSGSRGALYSAEPTRPTPSWGGRVRTGAVALLTVGVVAALVIASIDLLSASERGGSAVETSKLVDVAPDPFIASQSPLAGEPYVDEGGFALDQDGKRMEWSGYFVDGFTHEDEPFAPLLFRELKSTPMWAEPVLGYLSLDFNSAYVNVTNGVRRSYVADDPALTVWFFGGSTMYGIGQRDDYTIASAVARLAEQEGVAIEPVNFGVSGDTNWQGTERFEQAITSREAPDLVVFYDGTNEYSLRGTIWGNGAPLDGLIERQYGSDEDRAAQVERAKRQPLVPLPEPTLELSLDQAGDQYRRGVDLGRAVAKGYGVPIVHFWQPQARNKVPHDFDRELEARLGMPAGMFAVQDPIYYEIRDRSGADFIDISAAMDVATKPVYFDWSHHNEYGATLVADAMYEHLRPQLVELAGS